MFFLTLTRVGPTDELLRHARVSPISCLAREFVRLAINQRNIVISNGSGFQMTLQVCTVANDSSPLVQV